MIYPKVYYQIDKISKEGKILQSLSFHNVITDTGLNDFVDNFFNVRSYSTLVLGEGTKDIHDNYILPDKNRTDVSFEVGRKQTDPKDRNSIIHNLNTNYILYKYKFGFSELICSHQQHSWFDKEGRLIEVGLGRLEDSSNLDGNIKILSIATLKDKFGNPLVLTKTRNDNLVVTAKFTLLTRQTGLGIGNGIFLLPIEQQVDNRVNSTRALVTYEVRDNTGNRVQTGGDANVQVKVRILPETTTAHIFDPDIQGLVLDENNNEITDPEGVKTATITFRDGRVTVGFRSFPEDKILVDTFFIVDSPPENRNWIKPDIFPIQFQSLRP